jgi:hypothetical protein
MSLAFPSMEEEDILQYMFKWFQGGGDQHPVAAHGTRRRFFDVVGIPIPRSQLAIQ